MNGEVIVDDQVSDGGPLVRKSFLRDRNRLGERPSLVGIEGATEKEKHSGH